MSFFLDSFDKIMFYAYIIRFHLINKTFSLTQLYLINKLTKVFNKIFT